MGELSSIGLPRNCTRKNSNCVPFHKKSSKEFGFFNTLDWFVESDLAKNTVNNNILITEMNKLIQQDLNF